MAQHAAQAPLHYPESPREDRVDQLHGVAVADPYRSLEAIDAPETATWVDAQAQLTEAYLAGIPARKQLQQRLTELWNFEKFDVPVRHGERYFLTHNDGLQNQGVLYWLSALDAEPRPLLDPNQLSSDGTVALSGAAISDDGNALAYGLSAAGSDWQTWRIKDVVTGQDRDDVIEWVKFSGASWTRDGDGFFYSRYDAPSEGSTYKGANYNHKLYFHRVGTPQSVDVLIYQRLDHPDWGFNGEVTDDGRYLVITIWQGTKRENAIAYRDLQTGDDTVVELLPAFDAHYSLIGNDGPVLYFFTDRDAPLGRVVAIDLREPEQSHWRVVVAERGDSLQQVHFVNDLLIATYLHDARSDIKIYDRQGSLVHQFELPGIGTAVGFSGRRADRETFYLFTSFNTPGTVYHLDLQSFVSTVFREPRLGFDPHDYVTEQVFYPSKDGTRIPMFLSYRRGTTPDGDRPTYLYGYGGFNIPVTPVFSAANLQWMELGGIYAQACLRGGGEYGTAWHDAGSRHAKQNVFDDFIAAGEWLIANNYTRSARLAIGGGSNGGLLVGACLTQRPDLWGACLPNVGVLDMLRFHLWTIGWAWMSDYGSPDDADDFRVLLAYSPYHNLKSGTCYPPTLIMTGDHDDRVFPAHSFKFAAALQHAQTCPNPVLIRIEQRAGHGAGKPTSKIIAERADAWSFLVRALGMEAALVGEEQHAL